jgi:uncharacterized LabA/DUF88 family protein
MPKKIGVFCDVSNLYFCIGKKFNHRKLDYQGYLSFIEDLGEVVLANAYGAQVDNEAVGFITALKKIGYTCKFKKPKEWINGDKIKRKADHDVNIAIDIVDAVDDFDIVVIGSADSDLAPVVRWVMNKGKKVVIFACGIAKELRNTATKSIEVIESQLEEVNGNV